MAAGYHAASALHSTEIEIEIEMRDRNGTTTGSRGIAAGSLRSTDVDASMPAGVRTQILADLFASGERVVAWASTYERRDARRRRSRRGAGALVLTNERLLFFPSRAARRWFSRAGPGRSPWQMGLREFTQVRTTPSREETRVEILCTNGTVWEVFESGHRSSLAGALYAQRRALDA